MLVVPICDAISTKSDLTCETTDQLFAEHFPLLFGKLIPEVSLSILDTSPIHYSIGS
jgi:hypothetical protein